MAKRGKKNEPEGKDLKEKHQSTPNDLGTRSRKENFKLLRKELSVH